MQEVLLLHFAYGSTLDLEDYAARGYPPENLRPAGRAWLPDHELRFSRYSHGRRGGVLNLAPATGSRVAGALYDVTPRGWHDLDRKEGHPHAYARRDVTVIDELGHERAAVAYVAPDEGFVRPRAAYVAVVRRGMAAQGVDGVDALERAAAGLVPGDGWVQGELVAIHDPRAARGRRVEPLGTRPGGGDPPRASPRLADAPDRTGRVRSRRGRLVAERGEER